jgi:hypothetical protein
MSMIGNIDISNIILLITILVYVTSIILLSSGTGKKIVEGLIKGVQVGAAGSVIATAINTEFGKIFIKKDENNNSSNKTKESNQSSDKTSSANAVVVNNNFKQSSSIFLILLT